MTGRIIFVFIINLMCLARQNNAGLTCYSCETASITLLPSGNKKPKPCTNFTETEEFERDCPYSSYCMKKTTELVVQNGETIRIEERGCAQQKHSYPEWREGQWKQAHKVKEEIYKEGCFPEKNFNDLKAAKSTYCYCSSDLCNSGKRTSEISFFHHTDAMSVIFIFNVVKFMRNVR